MKTCYIGGWFGSWTVRTTTILLLLLSLGGGWAKSWNDDDGSTGRIVGGREAMVGRFSYHASLTSTKTGYHTCGAVLIAPNILLTAAHCVLDEDIDDVLVAKIGYHNLYTDNTNAADNDAVVTMNVTSMIRHPLNNPDTDTYDVGLLVLEQRVTTIAPIRPSFDTNLLVDGMNLTVIGFGDLGNGTYPPTLHQVQVQYMNNDDCLAYRDPYTGAMLYQDFVTSDMMCALGTNGTTTVDACAGDSGGPLLFLGNNNEEDTSSESEDRLIGITSWGIGCARMPGVYARLDDAYIQTWIIQETCRLSSSSSSSSLEYQVYDDDALAYLNCSSLSTNTRSENGSTTNESTSGHDEDHDQQQGPSSAPAAATATPANGDNDPDEQTSTSSSSSSSAPTVAWIQQSYASSSSWVVVVMMMMMWTLLLTTTM